MFIQKSLILIALSMMCVACGAGKIKISGQVVSASGLPVVRAEVVTMPPTDIVSTDKDGYFYVDRRIIPGTGEKQNIPPGIYQIRVTKEGFLPLEFSVPAQKGGEVWADRHTMQAEKAMINSVAPNQMEEPETMPTGAGGMVGF
jgi:hypothetical protein